MLKKESRLENSMNKFSVLSSKKLLFVLLLSIFALSLYSVSSTALVVNLTNNSIATVIANVTNGLVTADGGVILTFNVTGTESTYYKCIPYVQYTSFGNSSISFGPEPPMQQGGMGGMMTEDPMIQMVKYRNNTLYNVTVWRPSGSYLWNIMCAAPTRHSVNISKVNRSISIVMGDLLSLNNTGTDADSANYTVNFSIPARNYGPIAGAGIMYSFLVLNGSTNLTLNLSSYVSMFNDPTNYSMPPECDGSANQPSFCDNMAGNSITPYQIYVWKHNALTNVPENCIGYINVTVNEILQPPSKFNYTNGQQPMPTVRFDGTFAAANYTVNITSGFKPYFDFKTVVCAAAERPTFCNDTARFNNAGFFFKDFEDCFDGIDNDNDKLIDLADSDCFFLNNTGENLARDNSSPYIMKTSYQAFSDMIMFDFQTDKMSNSSITIYNQGTMNRNTNKYTCSMENITIYDAVPQGLDDVANAKFRPFHHLETNHSLTSGTSFYYIIKTCNRNGYCTMSECTLVPTTSTPFGASAYTFGFTPPSNVAGGFMPGAQNFTGLPSMKFVLPNGNQVDVSSGPNSLQNKTNITFRFQPPTSDGWMVDFGGADFTGDYSLNFASAFAQKTGSFGRKVIGMNHTTWLDIVQNLKVDYIDITLPNEGAFLTKCNESGLNCIDVTNSVKKLANPEAGKSKWRVPTSLGFSTYTTSGTVTLSTPSLEYQIYEGGKLINVTMNTTALLGSSVDHLLNITFFNSTTNSNALVNSIEFLNASNQWFPLSPALNMTINGTALTIFRVNLSIPTNDSTKATFIWQIVNSTNGTYPAPANYSIDIYGSVIMVNFTNPTNTTFPTLSTTLISSYNTSATCNIVNASSALLPELIVNFPAVNATPISRSFVQSLAEGNHSFEIKCTNTRGDIFYSSNSTIIIDTTPPIVYSIIFWTNGTNITRTGGRKLNITVNASDAMGFVVNITVGGQYLVNSTTTIGLGQNERYWNQSKLNVTLASDGTLQVITRDNAGNIVVNETPKIFIDNSAPVTTATVNKTAGGIVDITGATWYNVNINVSLIAVDIGWINNVSNIWWRNGTSGAWAILLANISFGTNITENIVQFRANDSLGNTEAPYQQKYIKIDKTTPLVSSIRLGATTVGPTTSFVVSAAATDTLSGLSSVVAWHNGTTGSNISAPVNLTLQGGRYTGNLIAPTAAADYAVWINATDIAGNSNITENHTFTVSAALPTFVASKANMTYVANNSLITFTVNNVSFIWYNTTANSNIVMSSAGASSVNIGVNGTNGTTFNISMSVNNSAGAIINVTYQYNIDTITPSLTFSEVSDEQMVNGTKTIIAIATDSESGVANVSFYVNNNRIWIDSTAPYTWEWNTNDGNVNYNADTNYTINITAMDYAGNFNLTNFLHVIVNNSAPVTVSVVGGVADFSGTGVYNYLTQVKGLNSTTAKAVVKKTAIVTPPTIGVYTAGDIYLSMNISAKVGPVTNGDAYVYFKLPKLIISSTTALSAFTTHDDGSVAQQLGVSRDSSNDDADNYAYYYTTKKFSVFTIATQKDTSTPAGGTTTGGPGGASCTSPVSLTEDGTLKRLKIACKATFEYGGGVYTMSFDTVSGNEAEITITPRTKSYSLGVGDAIKKDLDGDGDYDVEISLAALEGTSYGTFRFKLLEQPLAAVPELPTPKEEPKKEAAPEEAPAAPSEEPEVAPVEFVPPLEKKDYTSIVLVVAALILLGGAFYYYYSKPKKS